MKAIEVNNISKHYRIGLRQQKGDTFVGQLLNTLKSPINNFKRIRNMSKLNAQDETLFKALNDISFSVNKGEVLGIIGHNGAGKSTLLKILSRITEPTSGEIKLNGRVSALLEVGTGFHPELTGRDNIYMNGTILGMTKKEIDYKLDEIIDFSGIETHIDTPVKFYSSGMKVRLGFAVAAHLEPEILIIDEVLAVGDVEFQQKCLGKMQHVSRDEGRTILFVSHQMTAVKNLCTRCITLNHGDIQYDGNVSTAIDKYLSNGLNMSETGIIPVDMKRDYASTSMQFTRVQLLNHINMPHKDFYYGEPIQIKVSFTIHEPIPHHNLSVMIGTLDGQRIVFSEKNSEATDGRLEPGSYEASLSLNTPLLPGSYSVYLGFSLLTGKTLDWVERVHDFHVLKTGFEKNKEYRWEESWGYVLNQTNWQLKKV
ncbi:MAG: ABC transporter ATP-binding protein [Bacteroidia bacterium]|jgi:lipopolysaccharide transport system ATP-binding protein|nr:ABC transporter ATP-binding protein [Bacteroidia bacterium]